MASLKFNAPLPLRREVRAHLDFEELYYKEYKGWWSSTFVVHGPSDRITRLSDWVHART